MNDFAKIFVGILILFSVSLVGVFGLPYFQLGQLQPEVNVDDGTVFPPGTTGLAQYGAQVYAANGCAYCHTQVVRPEEFGADIARGWGKRHTVARDYINDKPVLLGLMRMGPDLANVGARLPDAQWHYRHLWEPRSITPWSNMPAHKFLFKVQRISGERSDDALDVELPQAYQADERSAALSSQKSKADSSSQSSLAAGTALHLGWEVVPTNEAKALVAYLLSLRKDYPLPESPMPKTEEAKK